MTMRLGHVQRHVLLVLSTRGASARNDWAAWYPVRPEQVYGAIEGLGRRHLVDVAGFENGARTFQLTKRGYEVVDELCEDGAAAREELVYCTACLRSDPNGIRCTECRDGVAGVDW